MKTCKIYNCLYCGKECAKGYSKLNKYCDNVCQRKHQREQFYQLLVEGKLTGRKTIRKLLAWKFGWKCFECGLSEWRGHTISLELDHIDGNAGNNNIDNLQLLCPNCHSITDTWKGRNRGNGRASRGMEVN